MSAAITEDQELTQRLEQGSASDSAKPNRPAVVDQSPPQPATRQQPDFEFSRWQTLPNGLFRPGMTTIPSLPAGVYRLGADDFGPFLASINLKSDDIIELPEPAHLRVLVGIRKFWKSKGRYHKHGLLYKRGVLLWGPPGGGKTVTAQLLARDIVANHGGIVLLADHPELTVAVLRILRKIEPSRPLIVMLEDVDEILARHGEHALLATLDGEHQTDGVVYIATTNYPERLGARIVNRPSRFDERIKVDMPSRESRLTYLRKTCAGLDADIQQWCDDTEGLSIAHLRELVVAVICLEQDYASVIERLRSMEIRPKDIEGFKHNSIGYQDVGKTGRIGAGAVIQR